MSSARAARSRCPCRATSPSSRRRRRSAGAVDELGWAACRAWSDVLRDLDANEAGAELYREMVRRTIDDPETADDAVAAGLPDRVQAPDPATPTTTRRSTATTCTLVDLRAAAASRRSRPTGIQTEQGFFELDVIVFATGFDAMTGALFRIDIRGRDGLLLRDAWADGAAHAPRRCRPPGSRTSSPSPGRGARRCSRTWSCASSSTSS